MVQRYSVQRLVAADGERMCFARDAETGRPVFEATVYALSVLRPASGSHSTVEQSLRGVVAFMNYLHSASIDLPARIASGRFLELQEIDGLLQALHAQGSRFRVPRRGHCRNRVCRRPRPGTVAIRLGAIEQCLDWQIQLHGHRVWATLDERKAGEEQAKRFLKRLRARIPRARSRCARAGLTAGQMAALFTALHRLADKAEQAGDAESRFIADRVLLWFDWQLEAGHRTGEMLGIRLRDIDHETCTYKLIRRPDAQDDPRVDLARVKGEGRELPMSPYLAERIRQHEKLRASLPRAEAHDFLFVACNGVPLSRSSVNLMFRQLREENIGFGANFCSHIMRYSWVERFSEDAAASGLSESETMHALALVMGWRDPESVRHYHVARTRRLVAKVSRSSQEHQMAARRAGRD